MAITDPQAIVFVNTHIRPRCEQIRALLYLMQDDTAKWNSGISALIPNSDSEELEDGREGQGVGRLDGADINNVMARIGQLLAVLEADYAMDVINLACVRELRVD